MKKFRVGVVGCGGIATWTHLPAYTQLCKEGLAEVVGLSDIKLEKTQPPLEFWPDAYTTADYHDFLKDETIDVIDICTPNYLHSIIAIEAMKAGKHVFCEKPDAITVEEVEMMKKTSEETGKRLMIMRNNRYLKSSQYLKKQIERGEFGDMYCGRCGWQRRRGIPGKGGWFTTKEQSGGGPLIDLGVHMIDLAMYLMGNPRPVSVSGATFCKFADNDASADSANAEFGEKQENGTFDVEDLAMGFIRFENGAVLQVATGRPAEILVIVSIDGQLRLASGVVYNFYQFEQPLSQRLTDTEWRQMIGEWADADGRYQIDNEIEKPWWTKSYWSEE